MNEPTPFDRRQTIDTRSLIAQSAVRAALRGLCWSLLVAVPVAVVTWDDVRGGFWQAMVALGGVCAISATWSAVAAFVAQVRVRNKTLTIGQRAVVLQHVRVAARYALGLTVLAVILGNQLFRGVPAESFILLLVIIMIWVTSLIIGWAGGHAVVLAVKSDWRAKVDQMTAPRESPVANGSSENVSPAEEGLSEAVASIAQDTILLTPEDRHGGA